MKILYHHRTRSTDAQRIHIRELMRAFRALGHEVSEAALVPADTELDNAARDAGEASWKALARRIPYAYEAALLGYNFGGLPMLLWRAWKWRPDAIYERYALHNFAGVLAGRLLRIPVVLEVNSPLALEHHRDGDLRWFGLARWTERRIANLAASVVAVSGPLRDLLVDGGVTPRKIHVMPNGVDSAVFSACAAKDIRSRLGLAGRTVVGFVGWFRNWHRIDLLLEAFRLSGLAGRGGALLLVGDGPAGPQLRSLAARQHPDVVFTGPVPHADVPDYAAAIDVAVQPAANEYCCPMKILEYMALGKAIVAPRQRNIEELLRDHVEGRLFTPGDAGSLAAVLTEVALNEDQRRALGAQARTAVESRGLTWTANARRVIEALEAVGASGRIQAARQRRPASS